MPTIKVSEETWQRLQAIATPFRGSELGTPDKVIERACSTSTSRRSRHRTEFRPARVDAFAELGCHLNSRTTSPARAPRGSASRVPSRPPHTPCGSSQARPKRSSSSLSAKVPHELVAPGRAGDAGLLVVERKVRSRS